MRSWVWSLEPQKQTTTTTKVMSETEKVTRFWTVGHTIGIWNYLGKHLFYPTNYNVHFCVIIFLVSNAKLLTWCLVSRHKINRAPSSSALSFISLNPPSHRLYSHQTSVTSSVDSPTLFLRLGSHAFLLSGLLWIILSSPHSLVYFFF